MSWLCSNIAMLRFSRMKAIWGQVFPLNLCVVWFMADTNCRFLKVTHLVMTLYLSPFSKMLVSMADHMAHCLRDLQIKDSWGAKNQDLLDLILKCICVNFNDKNMVQLQ